MTDCFRKVSLVLLFLLAGTAMLPALDLITSIAEIETIRGEQKYLYINGGKKKAITLGMIALIYNPAIDAENKKAIGRAEVIEVYQNISKVKIVELNDKISRDGYLLFGEPYSEHFEKFQAKQLKQAEEIRKSEEKKRRQKEYRLKSFAIMKYNGGDSLYLTPNARVKLSVGQVGVINGTNSGKGSLSGSGEVEVVRLFQNALLVRLREGAYINSLDSVVTFLEDKREKKGDTPVLQAENWLVSSVRSVKEEEGKLYVKGCSETILYKPNPGSTGYIYSDNMLLEPAAVVRFSKEKIEVVELKGAISPHGVLLFQGSINHDSGFVNRGVSDFIPPAIGEVKEVDRLQAKTVLYVTIGKKEKGYKPGLYGYVYTDSKRTILAGKVKVLEVYSRLSKVEVISEYETITSNSVVIVDLDPSYLVKESD